MHDKKLQIVVGLLIFLISGCFPFLSRSVFKNVPEGKPTSSVSEFYLIDDFNSGIGKSKAGGEWQTKTINGGEITLIAQSEDALNHWGGSASLDITLEKGAVGIVKTDLQDLDASQATSLALLVQTKAFGRVDGKIAIRLTDYTERSQEAPLGKFIVQKHTKRKPEWSEVVIPRKQFATLDFDQLERFEIVIKPKRDLRTRLTFDEIAFHGPSDLVFISARDNLVGFPKIVTASERRHELLQIKDDQVFLREIADDTWGYFRDLIDQKTKLPVDHIRVGSATGVGNYVSPTNAALHWLAALGAKELGLISEEEALSAIDSGLTTMEQVKRWRSGFWYNYYNSRSLRITRDYISTVDNGWVAAALIILKQAYPERYGDVVDRYLRGLDFKTFYDPSNGQIRLGFDETKNAFEPYHYGLLATEARLISYVAIGLKELEPAHWARIFRTLPEDWDWQKQQPEGYSEPLFGVDVFEGHYKFLNRNFVPSWGGSLFEFLAPTLIVNETRYGEASLGKNDQIVTDLQIRYARGEKKYPVWGIAPCAIQNGKGWTYREYGIPEMGAKGYSERGVIAPYASFLALDIKPKEVVQNARALLERYPDLYGEYGYYDSVQVKKGTVNHQYLALDQAMIFLAIVNHLTGGAIQNYFHESDAGRRVEKLLSREKFSI